MGKRKKANGDGSIYKRSSGQWVGTMSCGSIGGKRVRKSCTGKTREEVRRKLRELQTGSSMPEANERLSDFLTRWLKQEVKPNRAENTYLSYSDECIKRIIPTIGSVRLNRFRPIHVQTMLATLTERETGARTLENCYTVLSTACENALRMGMLKTNPCAAVTKPKRNPKEIFPFNQKEGALILKETSSNRLHGVFVMALTLGLRQGEIFGLRWKCVDFDSSEVKVNLQAVEVRGRLVMKKPKTKASLRTLKLSKLAHDSLIQRRANAMKEGNAGSEYVFCGKQGQVTRRSNFGNRDWKPLLKNLELDHRGFHHCRHTAATLMLSGGVPLHAVSRILGHSRPSITLDLYSHFMPEDAESASEVVAKLLG